MRKLFWTLVTILAVTFSGFFGFGMNLPKTHAFTIQEVFEAPQAEVWKAITDYEHLPNWSPNITRVERLHDLEGKPLWRLHAPYKRYMDLHIIEEAPEFMHVSEIIDGNYPFTGIWSFRIVKGNDDKVLVELTEKGVIESPFWRVMMHKIIGLETGAQTFMREMGAYLKTIEPVAETEEVSEAPPEEGEKPEDDEPKEPTETTPEESATE